MNTLRELASWAPGVQEPVVALPAAAIQLPLPLEGAAAPLPIERALGVSLKIKPRSVMLSLQGRCAEKGCVFPEAPEGGGRCVHHRREQDEPALYGSRQPSSAVMARGKFGPARADEIRDNNQVPGHDRRRLIAERESFLRE
ncbi:MAG TPA: hypothetical protein VL523_19185 [Terriglobia bacterium]|nr:hypothetical protein [Terriglobia bacterium]